MEYIYLETKIFKGSQRNHIAPHNYSGNVNSTVATLRSSALILLQTLCS